MLRVRRLLALAFAVAFGAAVSVQAGPDDSFCGNGTIEGPELCDDGNTVSDDACSFPSCRPVECGDDIVNPDPPSSEECDDGNTVAGDGCDYCELECGDGTLQGSEDCDDAGESALCDDDCTFIECGDDTINEVSGETCDDGNTVDGDGCPSDCYRREPLSKAEQACISAVNQSFARVARAQARDAEACVRAVGAGDSVVAECFGTDATGKVAKAQAAAAATFVGRKCPASELPTFAFTTPVVVNDAAELETLAAFTAVFGQPPALVGRAADAAGARCQAEAAKQLVAVSSRFVLEANRAKKAALRGGKRGIPPPVDSASALGEAIDVALAASPKLGRAEASAVAALAKHCPLDPPIDALFDCGGVVTSVGLAQCVVEAAKQAACEALELADAIPLDCPTLAP